MVQIECHLNHSINCHRAADLRFIPRRPIVNCEWVLELNILLFIYSTFYADKNYENSNKRKAFPSTYKLKDFTFAIEFFLPSFRIVKHNETFLLYHFSFIVLRTFPPLPWQWIGNGRKEKKKNSKAFSFSCSDFGFCCAAFKTKKRKISRQRGNKCIIYVEGVCHLESNSMEWIFISVCGFTSE